MASDPANPLYLVEFFRELYATVLHYRTQLDLAGAPMQDEDSVQIREADILAEDAVPGQERSELAPDMIQAHLLELIESQVQAVQRRGDARVLAEADAIAGPDATAPALELGRARVVGLARRCCLAGARLR